MFNDLIDILILLATLPNRGVVLTEAAFVIVAFLFALEVVAPLIILVGHILIVLIGLILKASALPQAPLRARRRLPRRSGNGQAPAPITTAALLVRPAANQANRVCTKSSDGGETLRAHDSIEGLARVISEARS
jgi:hypothetical protein